MRRLLLTLLPLAAAFFTSAPSAQAQPRTGAKVDSALFRQYETRAVSAYRRRVPFQDPWAALTSGARPASAAPQDSTPRRLAARFELEPALQNLLRERLERNAATTEVRGFRIQVYTGASRETASSVRFGLADGQEKWPVYQSFERPYFKVRVGDFLSRDEAERALADVQARYPDAFIVPSLVRMPK